MGNESDIARKRFRSVLRLNILLSTIISSDPTLRWPRIASDPSDKQPDKLHSLLKHVTAILVRDNEIVAAMAHKVGPSLLTVSSSSEPAPYQVNVMRTEQPESFLRQDALASRASQTDQGGAFPPAITTIANPHSVQDYRDGPHKDPYFEKAPPGVDCLEVRGQPHFLMHDAEEPISLERVLKIR